ncbi:hypothetical protein JW823_07060 [bacterium]|nr:hypothetical protein [candidate division CSSED10-310 bacterium]
MAERSRGEGDGNLNGTFDLGALCTIDTTNLVNITDLVRNDATGEILIFRSQTPADTSALTNWGLMIMAGLLGWLIIKH